MADQGSVEVTPGGDDKQVLGHLIGSFSAISITLLIDFGVPLTAAQQRDILTFIAIAWGLFSALVALHTRRPATPPAPEPNQPPPDQSDQSVGRHRPAHSLDDPPAIRNTYRRWPTTPGYIRPLNTPTSIGRWDPHP